MLKLSPRILARDFDDALLSIKSASLRALAVGAAAPHKTRSPDADVAELVDALDLGSSAVRRGGSSPLIRTRGL
jgi:hypothetical protein